MTPSHLPGFDECGLGRVEYDNVMATKVSELADPIVGPPGIKARVARSKYNTYTPETRALANMHLRIGMKENKKAFLS